MFDFLNYVIFLCLLCAVHSLNYHEQSEWSCHEDNCVTMPEGCALGESSTKCQAMLVWNVTELGTQLRLTGHIETNQYVAVGLSSDDKMGDDLVMDCLADESALVHTQFSFNVRQGVNRNLNMNETLSSSGMKLEGTTRMNGQVMCQWLWDEEVIVDNQNFERSASSFHILLAVGPFTKNGQGKLMSIKLNTCSLSCLLFY